MAGDPSRAPAAPAPTLQALLLEDSPFDAELLGEVLKVARPGIALTWVKNEAAFVAALAAQRFDLVLSDFQLPSYSGSQALDHATAVAPETPFIFVSGVIGEDNAVDLLKRGATDYVIKGRLTRLPVAIDRALAEVAQREARRAVEAQLREADALYARVIDSLQDHAVVLLDRDGRIRSWNRAAQTVFGYSRAGVIDQSAEMLLMPEERGAGVLARELATALEKGFANDDRWLMRADGARFRGEGVVTPLQDGAGRHNGYSMLVRDSTAAYNASQALRLAKEEAERANRAKDRFIATLSHELRTPLTPIAAAAHVLERCATVPSQYEHLLPMIRRNIALEARLIDDLLDVTSIRAGKVGLKLQLVDLHRLLRSVVEMTDGDFRAKRLELALSFGAVPCRVVGDEARLQQIVWNLVRNAVKFTPEGGRIELALMSKGGRAVVRCSDSGIGIAADALRRIFVAFEQADDAVPQRFGGLGLGLAIAKGLAEQHDGTLTAASDGPGRGAVFELSLPCQGVASSAAEPVPAADAPASSPEGLKLLLVEDNVDAAEALVEALQSFGHSVVHAATRRAAMDLARAERFDVIVSDLGLPDGSGIEIGRAFGREVPVIALSGYSAARDKAESAQAGFVGHLVKPAEPESIHAMLRQVVGKPAGTPKPH